MNSTYRIVLIMCSILLNNIACASRFSETNASSEAPQSASNTQQEASNTQNSTKLLEK